MQSEKALSVLGHHPVTLPVDFNFNDIEEIFEVYDYLTPNDARAVLKKREEMGYNLSDFIVQFTKSFRRAPVIPEDIEMTENDVLSIYPRANLFLISDEVRKGQSGLYTSVNGRKPFLNAWDNAKDWDVRMRKIDANIPGFSDISLHEEESQCNQNDQSELIEQLVSNISETITKSSGQPPSSEELCIPDPSEGQDNRTHSEEQSSVHCKEDVAPYNLRNRPAPYEVPPRRPGLHGLGHSTVTPRSRATRKSTERMKIPPISTSFTSGPTLVALPSGQHQALPSTSSSQNKDENSVVPMDEDVLQSVVTSKSEHETKEAISNGCLVVGGKDGRIYIVRQTSITTKIAEKYVLRYQQILQERTKPDS